MQRLITVMLLASAVAMPAQVRKPNRNVDQTTNIINDCEQKTNNFKKTLDRALGRDNVRAGQGRENQLNQNAEPGKPIGQGGRLVESRSQHRQYEGPRASAIAIGNDINNAMRNWNMGGDAESEWAAIRGELNRLAGIFGTPRIR